MLRDIIFEVDDYEGYSKEGLNLRLMLRNKLKELHPNIYFKEEERFKPAKNLGCYLFGQPDTWKGVISINNPEDGDVLVELDKTRSVLNKEEVLEILEPVMDYLLDDYVFSYGF